MIIDALRNVRAETLRILMLIFPLIHCFGIGFAEESGSVNPAMPEPVGNKLSTAKTVVDKIFRLRKSTEIRGEEHYSRRFFLDSREPRKVIDSIIKNYGNLTEDIKQISEDLASLIREERELEKRLRDEKVILDNAEENLSNADELDPVARDRLRREYESALKDWEAIRNDLVKVMQKIQMKNAEIRKKEEAARNLSLPSNGNILQIIVDMEEREAKYKSESESREKSLNAQLQSAKTRASSAEKKSAETQSQLDALRVFSKLHANRPDTASDGGESVYEAEIEKLKARLKTSNEDLWKLISLLLMTEEKLAETREALGICERSAGELPPSYFVINENGIVCFYYPVWMSRQATPEEKKALLESAPESLK